METEEGEGPTYLVFGGRWGTAVRSEARKEGGACGDEGRGGGDPSGDG